MKSFASRILLAFAVFSCIFCSRISSGDDDEYRKRLEEYYKSIGVSPPGFESLDSEQRQDNEQRPDDRQAEHTQQVQPYNPYEHQAPYDHQSSYDEQQVQSDNQAPYQSPYEQQMQYEHQSPYEQQVQDERQPSYDQQIRYDQQTTEPRHDLSPDEMYQQRLKEYYERLKEHNAVVENVHAQTHEVHLTYEQQTITEEPEREGHAEADQAAADNEYQRRLDEYYRQLEQHNQQQEQRQEQYHVQQQEQRQEQYQVQQQEQRQEQYQEQQRERTVHETVTEEPRHTGQEIDAYQRQLDEYYRQLERNKEAADTALSSTTTTGPLAYPGDAHEEEKREKPPTLTIDLAGDQRRYDPTGWLPRPVCPRPFLPNGFIKSMNAEKALYGIGEQYLSGTFQFECNGGYEPDPRVASMEVRCMDGQLSPLPRCRRIEVCEGIPKPMHGYVDVHHSRIKPSFKSGTFQVGTKFTFTCNHYAVPDSVSSTMESECMDGGVWSCYPKCVAMPTCDFFTYLNHVKSSTHHLTLTYRNVTIMHSPLHHGSHNVIPGSILQHACAPGYEMDQSAGSFQVVCKKDGHWTEFPRCVMSTTLKDSCAGMPDINAIYRNNLVAKTYRILQVGDQVTGNITFMCQDNYEPKYPDMVMTVTCRNRKWTDLPECQLKPLCDTDIRIPYGARIVDSRLYFLPGMQDKGYLPGSYIEFLCEPRSLQQITVRRSKVSCQQGGSWTQIHECSSGR